MARKLIINLQFKYCWWINKGILCCLIFSCGLNQKSEFQSISIESKIKKKLIIKDTFSQKNLPSKVLEITKYIKENGRSKRGYIGGRKFKNLEKLLPKKDTNGNLIFYREWDVNPIIKGKNRGKERLVTGSDGKVYYTNNHYKSFHKVE